ncbi:Rieske 2Fe-2S domain-containing protein [Pseudonocardia sp. GCM10023141]|uniref:Rieske 2Fe-2S domain-containing protein n=1 Tax=Pseudonocardia sp. GCM10023141 TaxID=3252653 RepID=UPI00360C81D9
MTAIIPDADDAVGRAYGAAPGTSDEELTRVGPGTPGGEFFRRYWLPFATAAEVTDRPVQVQLLGEHLVAFRDGTGRPGLVRERCLHRGTSLYYGTIEQAGIRCCHHGWLYDVTGHCLDQPAENSQGKRLAKFRLPWYPVQERYGLLFTYMGPAELEPVLTRYDVLEEDDPDYGIFIDAGTPHRATTGAPNPSAYNWLQMNESGMDAAHVEILHGNMGGAKHGGVAMAKPVVEYELTAAGMQYTATRVLPDGRVSRRVYENFLPCVHVGGNPVLTDTGRAAIVTWQVPLEDYQVRSFSVMRLPRADVEALADGSWTATMMGTPWKDRTEQARRDAPGDHEAQASLGRLTLHSHEHLVSSDKGVIMLRKLVRASIDAVREGGNPQNVHFAPEDCTVAVCSGNYLPDADTGGAG